MEEEMIRPTPSPAPRRTERRRGERSGHYGRALTTAAAHRAVRVPSAREMPLDRGLQALPAHDWLARRGDLGDVPPGRLTRKVEQITGSFRAEKISRDTVSPICARFEDVFAEWRERRLDSNRSYPYLYLDATYVKARWARAVRNVALLVAVGVSDEAHREVLAVKLHQASAPRRGGTCCKVWSSAGCAVCSWLYRTIMSRSRARFKSRVRQRLAALRSPLPAQYPLSRAANRVEGGRGGLEAGVSGGSPETAETLAIGSGALRQAVSEGGGIARIVFWMKR